MNRISILLAGLGLASFVACTVAPQTTLGKRRTTATTKKDAAADNGDEETMVTEDGGVDAGLLPNADAGRVIASGETDSGAVAPPSGQDAAVPVHMPVNAPTWTTIYSSYFAPGTLGHCSGGSCHSNAVGNFLCGNSKASCYQGLVNAGLISTNDPTSSRIAGATSPLTWFGQGGDMPTGGSANPTAAADVAAWVSAGAQNN